MTNINWNSPEIKQLIIDYSQKTNIPIAVATARLKQATTQYQVRNQRSYEDLRKTLAPPIV